ncbi:MAG: peptidoglycan DD-metalloendopeptidase family protein [Bacteroidetes bacterium]|nr:peptidoglycan DD-metalloendopeptidase family protein [Bacteroidota bacterium]MCL2303530.1 peptidoglycan DD-metalloendopeptidase family protein [Lentimicrobiaceae bacterium]
MWNTKLFFLLIFSVLMLHCSAQTSDQLKANKKKLETEIADTRRLLQETQKRGNTSLQQIALLRNQINNREKLITELNKQVFNLELELDLNVKLSQNLDKKLEYMKADYERVVYLAFKNRRSMDKITFLLSADNFSQMYRRSKFFTIFSDNVKHQAEEIKKTQQEIAQKNAEILNIKEAKLTLLESKESEVKSLEKDRASKTKTLDELKRREKQLANELKAKQAKQREVEAAIKKAIEREILAANKKKAEQNKASSGTPSAKKPSSTVLEYTPEEKITSNSFVSNRGKLPWPVVKGSTITNFGRYRNPDVPSVMMESKGIDILVEPNTQVRSVFDGVVYGILDMGSAGKVVIIRHGEYITVYQGLATVTVKKDEKVTMKQNIGTVGKNMGKETHELHFEILKEFTHLDPASWLSQK